VTAARTLLAAAAVLAALVITTATSAAVLSSDERSLLQEMNRVRTAYGLPRLRVDRALQRAARAHSREMLRREWFAHGSVGPRLLRFGIRSPVLGENLAWGVGENALPRAVVRSWLASPSHRRNLLDRSFRQVGVASAVGSFLGYAGASVITTDFSGSEPSLSRP